MTKCKPGDMAVVIKGENCGTFVTVLHSEPNPFDVMAWSCKCHGPVLADMIDVKGNVIMERTLPAGSQCCFFDNDLQPIRPAPVKQKLPAQEMA